MVTSRPPGVLLTVAVVLLRLCIGVIAQAEDEAITNGLTAVDIIRIGDEDDDMIVGVAGNDYPTYAEVPDTSFRCEDQQSPGYFADQEAECQVFHICVAQGRRIQKFSFLCPNGTIFDQQYLVCVWWYSFDCAQASQFYSVNDGVFSDTGSPASPDGSNIGNPRFSGATGSVGGQPGSPRGGSAGSGSGFPNQGLGGSTGQAGLAGQPGSLGQPGSGGQGTAFGSPGSTDGFGPADRRPGSTGGAGTRDGRPGSTGGSGTRDGRPGSTGGSGTRDGRPGSTGGAGTRDGRPGSTGGAGTRDGRLGSTGGAGTRDGRPGSTGGAGTRDGRPGSIGGAGTSDGRPGSTGGAGSRDGRPGSAGRGQESQGPQGGFPATQGGFPRPSASGQPGQNNLGQNVADFPRQTQGQGGFGSPDNAINQNGFGPGQNIGDSGLGQVQGSSGPGQAGFSSQQPGRGIGQNGLGLSQQQPGQTGFGTTQGSFGPQRPSSTPGQAGFGQGQRGSSPGQSGFEQTGFGPGQNQRQPTLGQSGFSSGQPGFNSNQRGSAPGQNEFGSGQGLTGSTPQGGIGSSQTGFSGPGQTGTTQSQGFGPGQTQTGFGPGQTQTGFGPGQTQTGFGPGQTQTGFGPGQTQTGFEPGQTQAGFGPGQTQTGFGAGQTQSGFGAGQTQTGFGPGQTQTGFGPGQTQTGFGPGQTQSGFGSGQTQTGFGPGQTQPGFGQGQQSGFAPGHKQTGQAQTDFEPGQRQTDFGPGQNQIGFGSTQTGPGLGFGAGQTQPGSTPGQGGFAPGQAEYSGPSQTGSGQSQPAFGTGQTQTGSTPTQGFGSGQAVFGPGLSQTGQRQTGFGPGQSQLGSGPGVGPTRGDQSGGQFGQSGFSSPGQVGTGPSQAGIGIGQTALTQGRPTQNEGSSGPEQNTYQPNLGQAVPQGQSQGGIGQNQLQYDAVPGQDQSGIGQNQGQFGTGLGQNQITPNQGQGGFGTGPGQFGQREIVAGQTQPGFGPGQNQNEYQSDQQQSSFGPDVSSQSGQGSPNFGTDLNQGDVGLGVNNVIQDGISNQGSTRQTGGSQGQDIGYNYPTPETSLFIGSGPAQADFGTSGIDGTLDVQNLNQDEILLIDDQDSFDNSYQGEGGFQQPGQQTDFSSNNIGNTGTSGNLNEFLLIENQDPTINIGNIQDEIIVQHSEIPTSGGNLNNFENTGILTGDTGTNAFNSNVQGNSGYQYEQIQGNQAFQVNNNAQGNEILLTDDNTSNVGFSGKQNIAEGNGYSYPDPSSVATGTSLNDNQQTFSINVPLPPQSLSPITSGLPSVSDDTIFIFTSNNDNNNLGTTPYSDLPASKPASESHSQAEAPVPAGGFEPAITNFGSVSPGGLTQTTSGDFGLSSTGGITSNNAGGVPLPPQDYIPPTQEFAAQITESQRSPQFSFSGSSSGNISPNTFSFSSTPVSLTDSLKQEVVAPVTQEADSRFTFPSQPNIGSTLDFSTLEQGYLPPVDNAGISNIQPSLPDLSPASISFPSSSPSPFPGSGFSSTPSSPPSSYPGDSALSLEPSVSTSPQNPISFNPVSSVSSQSTPAGSPISGNGVNVGTTQSFPAGSSASGNGASGGNFGNVGNQQGGQQAISTPLDLGYLPPVSEFTRNTRQTGQHDNKIYVTPLPGVEKSFREVSGRRAFRPSVQITDGMDKLEFKPKTPAKPFGRVFFPSNRRSDTTPVRYIDNSRKSFVATSSSPFNPFNQYSLSLRS